MKAIAISAKPIATLLEVLILTVGFFILYNKFLVNRSLDDVKFALNTIEKNEYSGLNQLLSFRLAEEVAKEKSDSASLAMLEYVNDVIPKVAQGRSADDVTDVMRKLVAEKEEERGSLLRFFDRTSSAIMGALGFKAKMEQRLARNEKEIRTLAVQKGTLSTKLSMTKSPEEKQKLLYRIGSIDIRTSNYGEAAKTFNEASRLDPKTAKGVKALFDLAWCEKALGNVQSSATHFEDFTKRYAEGELAKDAAFQTAMLARKANDYRASADTMLKLADLYENSALAPIALFVGAGTYLHDLGDKEAAAKALEKLKERYPANEFASSNTNLYKTLFTEERMRQSLSARMFTLWSLFPMAGAIKQTTDTVATRFVIKMIEGTIKYIESQNLDVGSMVKIEQTDKFLTDWSNNYLTASSKDRLVGIRNVKIVYKEGSRIEASGLIKIGAVNMPGRLMGKMQLKNIRVPEGLKEEGRPSTESWLTYNIEECNIGPIRVPPAIINESLARAHKIFNQKLPFRLDQFNIDMRDRTGVWSGPQRVPTSKLRTENPQQYEYLYKSK